MVIVHELIASLVMLVNIFFTILNWLLVARIVLSWFGVNPYTSFNDAVGALYQITDVILAPFRKLPLQIGLFDFSAVVAFIALQFVQRLVVLGLYQLSRILSA